MIQKSFNDGHLGQTNKRLQTGGITFTEALYTPNIEFPKHSHRNACFTLIQEGGYTEYFGKTVLSVKPNSVIFRPPEEAHSDKFGEFKVRASLIEIDKEWFENLSQQTAILICPAGFDNGQIVWQAMRLCSEFQQFDDVSPLAIEGLILEILARATRKVRKSFNRIPPRWLNQVKEILHDRFSQKLTLDEIAKTVGVHPAYLANTFREYFICSIGEYLRQLRIEFACRKIVSTNHSLVDIALSSGFSHQAHFNNIFKRVTGMTPLYYRSIYRQS